MTDAANGPARRLTVVCGWNSRASAVVETLREDGPTRRGRPLALVSDQPAAREYADRVQRFVPAPPHHREALLEAGILEAATAIVLSPANIDAPDPYVARVVLAVEKLCFSRGHEIRTVAELWDPANKKILHGIHADQVVCYRDFQTKLLAQACLNPSFTAFFDEIMTIDEDNEVYEVPAARATQWPVVGKTYDEVLDYFREQADLLLLGIHRMASGGRQLITNPSSPEERAYRIHQSDALLFLAESETPLEQWFGSGHRWSASLPAPVDPE